LSSILTVALVLTLLSVTLFIVAASLSALLGRHDRASLAVGTAGSVLACGVGLAGSVMALLDGGTETVASAWRLPIGAIQVGIDPLSAFFLLCIFLVCGLGALFGAGYMRGWLGRRRLAPALAFFNVLAASMVAVVLARDGVLFLLAWEAMSLSSFFLVTFEGDRPDTRRAGIVYLIASHAGLVPLILLFVLLGGPSGSFAFDGILAAGAPAAVLATTCFLLALAGFGLKAGFWPLHAWLPEAHPAAPSHVSAVMSGVMIKMGIYGLLRTLTFLGDPPEWWGFVFIVVGVVSGVGGILHAIAQTDLKRLLAYSSVENVGIVSLGLGLGLIGRANGNATMAFLGFGGALLHVLNHGVMKGLLFQAAGSVLHATGTRDLDSLGGLLRRMPFTGAAFLTGSVAISGLPPLGGFVGELLIYVGAFTGAVELPSSSALWPLVVVPALALIGGLASACFVKAFGVGFLGSPRTPAAASAHEASPTMRVAMVLGIVLCLAVGVVPAVALRLVEAPAQFLSGAATLPAIVPAILSAAMRAALALMATVGILAVVRWALLRRREVRQAATWGCGYEAPTARMQYTAASFADPVLEPSESIFVQRIVHDGLEGPFPRSAHHERRMGDVVADRVIGPAIRGMVASFKWLDVLQQGGVPRYLVWVLLTVVVLLVWQLGAF
jgi:formate hydrogenlyase subunit 3/multisubunit Na+/H+ antiporter MnhD subunit